MRRTSYPVDSKYAQGFSMALCSAVVVAQEPAPGAAPFVEAGDRVKKGQVLCIVEAMKLMNEIESEISGKILEVLVENGQPVQYDQTLFLVRTP